MNDLHSAILSRLCRITSSRTRLPSSIYGLTRNGNSRAYHNPCRNYFFFFNVSRFTLRK
jgi:hypothetical protein